MRDGAQTWEEGLKVRLIEEEGVCLKLYECPAGKKTVGIGHNIEDNGLSRAVVYLQFNIDVEAAIRAIRGLLVDFDNFTDKRKIALVDMMFNLGEPRFKTFKKMIEAINKGDWKTAKREVINSSYFRNGATHKRALSNARLLKG